MTAAVDREGCQVGIWPLAAPPTMASTKRAMAWTLRWNNQREAKSTITETRRVRARDMAIKTSSRGGEILLIRAQPRKTSTYFGSRGDTLTGDVAIRRITHKTSLKVTFPVHPSCKS